jgi:hypothetical protein
LVAKQNWFSQYQPYASCTSRDIIFSVSGVASNQSGTLSLARTSRFLRSCHPCLFKAFRNFSFAAIKHLSPQTRVLKLAAGPATCAHGPKREAAAAGRKDAGAGAGEADTASPAIPACAAAARLPLSRVTRCKDRVGLERVRLVAAVSIALAVTRKWIATLWMLSLPLVLNCLLRCFDAVVIKRTHFTELL